MVRIENLTEEEFEAMCDHFDRVLRDEARKERKKAEHLKERIEDLWLDEVREGERGQA